MIFLLFFCFSSLMASEPMLSLSSDEAIFDGQDFTLKGKVHLSHDLGHLKAEIGKTPHPSLSPVTFYQEVELSLKNGFTLKGKEAAVDHKKLTILFTGDPLICTYTYLQKPVQLTAKRALVSCISTASLKNLSFSQVQKVEFSEEVVAELDKKVSLACPHLMFTRENCPGPFQLKATSTSNAECKVCCEGNEILCHAIEGDLSTQVVCLNSPRGFFKIPFQSDQKKISFDAEKMEMDLVNKTVKLVKHIELVDENIASFSTEELMATLSDKYTLTRLQTRGMNKVLFRNNRSSLQCEGLLVLDLEQQTVFTEAAEDSYVFYQNPQMTLSAKKGFFAYHLAKKTVLPKSIELSGNIRFMTNALQTAQGFGIADKFSYLPDEKKLILSPEKGKKVLFWTDDKMMQLSANEIHIMENPITGEKRIEGKGDLRFTFTYDEEQFLFSNFKERK